MKLEYEQFKEKVISMLGEKAGSERSVGTGTVTKLNGQKLDSVYIEREGQEIFPTCYLDHFYEIYEDGMSLETIVSMIMDMGMAEPGEEQFAYQQLMDYEKVKDRICLRIVNTERNREMLESIPSIPFLDLSVVFYVLFINGTSQYMATVTDEMLDKWELGKQDLIKNACENTKRMNPLCVSELGDMIEKLSPAEAETARFEYEDEIESVPDVTVISSEYGTCGAVYMLDMSLMAEYARKYDDDLIIIPSSIHEVLILPASRSDREELDKTIRMVNMTALSAGEYLADHSYVFRRELGKITM